jgi:hypothetical protein
VITEYAIASTGGKGRDGDTDAEILHTFAYRLRRGAVGIHRFGERLYVDLRTWRLTESGLCVRSSIRLISLPAALTPELVRGFKEAQHRLQRLSVL